MPDLYVIAGPNGVGKTTSFYELVPQGISYINADLIARELKTKAGGLNTQDIANREAARIFQDKAAAKQSFAIETNLSDVDTYKSFEGLQALGYRICLLFLAVDDVEICMNRVRMRVQQGGHNINPDVIKQRYINGQALLKHYKSLPDVLILLDNTEGVLKTQAELRKGIVHFQSDECRSWVQAILKTEQSLSKKADETIEDVRKRYRRGRGV